MDRKWALNHTAVNYYAQLLHSGKLRVQKWSEGWAQCWLHLCLPQCVLIHCNTGLVGPVLSPLSKHDRSIVPHRLWQTPPSVQWALWQLTEENGHRLMHAMQNWTAKTQSVEFPLPFGAFTLFIMTIFCVECVYTVIFAIDETISVCSDSVDNTVQMFGVVFKGFSILKWLKL